MKILKILLTLSFCLIVAACSKETKDDADKAGDQIKDAAEATGDAMKSAGEDAKKTLEENKATPPKTDQ